MPPAAAPAAPAVFGPVPSRRLGRSLGINNVPPKACSYSCVYCQVGRTPETETAPRTFRSPGALLTYAASTAIEVDFLVPFAAGNFLYIGASDLVPEVNKHRSAGASVIHFLAFAGGIAVLWAIRLTLEP